MTFDTFLRNILSDLRVELTEEFDRNFERKAFFDVPWAPSRWPTNRGSLMIRTGALRSSIQSRADSNSITFSSSLPYASLHNDGGELTVTPKMKRFFWAMYYKTSGAITTKKNGQASNSKKNLALTAEAANWKRMALLKVGTKIKIPQRQFIGWHSTVDQAVRTVITDNAEAVLEELKRDLEQLSVRINRQ